MDAQRSVLSYCAMMMRPLFVGTSTKRSMRNLCFSVPWSRMLQLTEPEESTHTDQRKAESKGTHYIHLAIVRGASITIKLVLQMDSTLQTPPETAVSSRFLNMATFGATSASINNLGSGSYQDLESSGCMMRWTSRSLRIANTIVKEQTRDRLRRNFLVA